VSPLLGEPTGERVACVNIFGWVLLGALGVAGMADGVAVLRGSRSSEQLARPAFIILLLALAWLLHAEEAPQGRWLLIGLVLSLVGEVLLLSDSDRRFGLGLLSSLLVRLALLAALLRVPHGSPRWWGVVAVALVLVLVLAFVLVPHLRRDVVSSVPPTAYGVVLAVLAGAAWYTGYLLVGIGASLFVVSDALLGWRRVVRQRQGGRVATVRVAYHLALLLFVIAVLRPDLTVH